MLKKVKQRTIFIVLINQVGFTMLVLGCTMEILYRIFVGLGLLEKGLENLSMGFGIAAFVLLLLRQLTVYAIKRKINSKQRHRKNP